MLRGWILALATAGIALAAEARAQQQSSGMSLADRMSALTGSDEAEAQAAFDPEVEPAAVASEDARSGNRRPSAPRRSAGLFSRLRLPNLLPGSNPNAGELSDPPPAYDPSELQSRGATTQAQSRRATAPTPSTGSGNPSMVQNNGAGTRRPTNVTAMPPRTTVNPHTSTGAPSATTAPPTTMAPRTTAPTTTMPQRRVARSSPPVSQRHNELAEALTGLRDAVEAAEEESAAGSSEPAAVPSDEAEVEGVPADDSVPAGDGYAGEIPGEMPPAADEGEAAPSFLGGGRYEDAGATTPSAAGRGQATARGPVDIHQALGGGDATVPTPQRMTPPSAQSRRATGGSTGRRGVAVPAAPTRRSSRPSPTRAAQPQADIADALGEDLIEEPMTPAVEATSPPVVDAEDVLGEIAAEPIPESAVVPTPPTPTSSPGAEPPVTVVPNRINRAEPNEPASISNLRPKREELISVRAPVVVSSVNGPQQIVVGRTASYRIIVENKGNEAARDLTAIIAVPGWADVVDAAASNGAVETAPPAAEGADHAITWKLYELAAGASQTLTVELVPRSGRPLQLGVTCETAPVKTETTVQVQEPRLEMEISGPAEVMFGKSQRYTLTLSNPGTGDADEVSIELVPPGGDPASPVRHKVGTLTAGSSKKIELELTAREAGDLRMQAAATAAGDLRSEAVKTVLCRKAELDIDWRGPDKAFAGSEATYFIRVRNQGTAPADDVLVEIMLPDGAELVDASSGHSWDANRRAVQWLRGSIGSTEEQFMQIRCTLSNPGTNELELVARTQSGDLSNVKKAPVLVEAVADLKLFVTDPKGVLPVGETALYEIRVQNRGQTAARGVNVAAMFSEGIDPSHVEGGQHEIRDGRVAFRPIDSLPAGAEVVLKIYAKASSAGTHIFRAEVTCSDLDIKLAAEETTRYFVEEERWADASSAYSDEGAATTR
jgi:uncharacterized repeat protein (TIGR01451 family)